MMQRSLAPAIIMGLLTCPGVILAEDNDMLPGCKKLGTVSVVRSGQRLDKRTRNEIDALVPAIRKIGAGKMVRIEGYTSVAKGEEERNERSLNISKDVQLYLINSHNITQDLYLATMNDDLSHGKGQKVRIVVCPKQFIEENLDLSRNITDIKRDDYPSKP